MKPLSRVLRAPWLLLFVVLVQWWPAAGLGVVARAGAAGQLGPYSLPEGGSFLASVGELMADGGGLWSAVTTLMPILLVLGFAVWMTVLGAVIRRLSGPAPVSRTLAGGLSSLPGLIGATLWHLPLRALLVVLPFVLLRKAFEGASAVPALVVGTALLCVSVCALDFARCRVVLSGRSGWHPLTTWHALKEAVGRPGILAQSALWGLLQWACVIGIAWLTLQKMGGSDLGGWARALAFCGVFFGLVRLSVVIEALSLESEPRHGPETEKTDPVTGDWGTDSQTWTSAAVAGVAAVESPEVAESLAEVVTPMEYEGQLDEEE